MDTKQDEHRIAEPLWAAFQKAVDKWKRKAAKLGQVPITYQVIRIDTEPILDERRRDTGRRKVYRVIHLRGAAPKVAGYEFLARIEHTSAGNIITKAPGFYGDEIDRRWRDAPPDCAHCGKHRTRHDTFIVRETATGELQQIGRNCLADFIRSEDAEVAVKLWRFLEEVKGLESRGDDEETWGGGGGRYEIDTEMFVAHAFRAYHLHGWASASSSASTKNSANFSIGQIPKGHDEDARQHWRELQPTDRDRELAKEALEWAKTMEGTSDYEHNLKIAATLPFVGRHDGLLASLTKAYETFKERAVERRQRETIPHGGHFGKVGSKYVRVLRVEGRRQIETMSDWGSGLSTLHTMRDEQGNVFKWFASGRADNPSKQREIEVGDEGWFSFTVRKHGAYKGAPETQITRASMLGAEPGVAFKWIGPDGEIYKSKKAFVAAGGIATARATKPRPVKVPSVFSELPSLPQQIVIPSRTELEAEWERRAAERKERTKQKELFDS